MCACIISGSRRAWHLRPSMARIAVVFATTMMTVGVSSANANDIVLDGTFGYSISGTRLTLDLGKIVNDRDGGKSGSLRVQLWATASPYSGGDIYGYILGTKNIGQLEGGYYFHSMSASTTYKRPPTGTYYVTLTLEEYTSAGFVIVDFLTFSGAKTFSSGTGASGSDLKLEGPASWSRNGKKLTIRVAKVSNASGSGTSGALRLKVWATTTPYSGGTIRGHVLGYVSLKKLPGGYYYSDINKTVSFKKPPNGTYYTALTLEEGQKGKYVIKSSINMNGTTVFGVPTSSPGGGGGIKKDWFTLNPDKHPTNDMKILRELGLSPAPTAGRGYQLWSYCATAMSYYTVYVSNPTDANWNYHATTAALAYQFYLKAPKD